MLTNPLADDLEHILERTADLWKDLREEQFFITGGTGFFGCWLLESFVWINHRLNLNNSAMILTRDVSAFQKKAPHLAADHAIKLHQGNILDFPFPAKSFSHIIHGAVDASAKLANEKPQLMYDTITKGTERTLAFAKQCDAQKLLFISSGAVYGEQPRNISHITENHVASHIPKTEKGRHGLGKLAAEEKCLAATKNSTMEIKIARCFAFIGPYLPLNAHFAIGNFISDGLSNKPIVINGDGTPYRSYMYASELVTWLWHILLRGKNCHAYNVGSEKEISIANLAHTVAKHFEPSSNVTIKQKANPTKQCERYVPSTNKAREKLGLKQLIDLDTSIKKTKSWHLKRMEQQTT